MVKLSNDTYDEDRQREKERDQTDRQEVELMVVLVCVCVCVVVEVVGSRGREEGWGVANCQLLVLQCAKKNVSVSSSFFRLL